MPKSETLEYLKIWSEFWKIICSNVVDKTIGLRSVECHESFCLVYITNTFLVLSQRSKKRRTRKEFLMHNSLDKNNWSIGVFLKKVYHFLFLQAFIIISKQRIFVFLKYIYVESSAMYYNLK